MNAWTDYPILALGDESGKKAPIRECEVLTYDRNKYCDVRVGGIVTNFKAGYLYTTPGRAGEAPCVSRLALHALPTDLQSDGTDKTNALATKA